MPRGRSLQIGDHAQQRGLAAARGADQRDELAAPDVQVDVGERDDRRVGRRVDERQAAHVDGDGRACRRSSGRRRHGFRRRSICTSAGCLSAGCSMRQIQSGRYSAACASDCRVLSQVTVWACRSATSTMVMQPVTGQACMQRLQPTHSSSITSKRRVAVARVAAIAWCEVSSQAMWQSPHLMHEVLVDARTCRCS